jgi:hypothetical protein
MFRVRLPTWRRYLELVLFACDAKRLSSILRSHRRFGLLLAAITIAVLMSASSNQARTLTVDSWLLTHRPRFVAPGADNGLPVRAQATDIAAGEPTDFSAPPYTVGNVVSGTTSMPEAEEHIVVDPNDSKNVVAAIIDFSRKLLDTQTQTQTIRFAYSAGNGDFNAWKSGFVNLLVNEEGKGLLLKTGDGLYWGDAVDPSIAIDSSKNVYLAQLYKDNFSTNGGLKQVEGTTGIYVSKQNFDKLGTNGFQIGKNQTVPVTPPNLDPAKKIDDDKPWIAVDSCSGAVYVVWTHFTNSRDSSQIYFSRSEDAGKTWSPVIKVSKVDDTIGRSGAQVAGGCGGEVYVVWTETNKTAAEGELFKSRLFMAFSDDLGAHFAAPKPITKRFNAVFEPLPGARYKINAFPAMAVNPKDGSVAVLYSAAKNSEVTKPNTQITFILSTNKGELFGEPQIINDDETGEHFFPALTADVDGVYHACWFDTRNSKGSNRLIDVFATYTKDDGKTFGKNAGITDKPVNVGTADFIGDYLGIAAAGGLAHPVWTNIGTNRGTTTGTLQTVTLTLPK